VLDKENFRKTEARIYLYYQQLKLIDKLKHKVVILYKQLESIKDDLKNTNIKIDPVESRSFDYSRERVTSSNNGTSYAESEIIRAIENLEKEYIYKKRKMFKIHTRIRHMEEEIEDMRYNLSLLNEESKQFIEWKYGEKKSIEFIAQKLCIAPATAYRKREELVEEIAQFSRIISN
jgi:hypothetical protein